jgi:hypothetical protein
MELTNGTSCLITMLPCNSVPTAKIYVTNVKNDNTTAGPNTILKRAIIVPFSIQVYIAN